MAQDTVPVSDGWDMSLPGDIQERWKVELKSVVGLETIYFPRSCKSVFAIGHPEMYGFHDGANAGHGGSLYLRYAQKHGGFDASLLGSKSKVGKLKNTPRDEMNGLLVLCRFITAVLEGMSDKPVSITHIGDSTCTILSVETDKKLKVWMCGKVDEVHRHMELWRSMGIKVEELFYIPGELNPADILTRGDVKPEQLQLGSEWQTGPDFLRKDRAEWPITRDFPGGDIPRAELLVKCFAVMGVESSWDGFDKVEEMAKKSTKLKQIVGTLARIIGAACKKDRMVILEEPTAKNISDAELLLQIVFGRHSVPDVSGKYDNLVPKFSKGRWVTRGRLGGNLLKLLGTEELVILDNKNFLSVL